MPLVKIFVKYNNPKVEIGKIINKANLFLIRARIKKIGNTDRVYRALLIPQDKEAKSKIELNEYAV